MAFARDTAIAVAGSVGKGGLANSKTVAYMNEGDTALVAGRFVALSANGVKALSAKTDVVAGVVVRTVIKDETVKGEVCDVMHIGVADSIWVEVAKDATVARGNTVYVVVVENADKKAGTIQGQKDETNAIATPFTVIAVADGVAEVTRL